MKVVWIDNSGKWLNAEVEKLADKKNQVFKLPDNIFCNPLESVVDFILERHADANIFIIDLNFELPGYLRSECLGIKLLKYLRLHHLQQHAMVYSFLTREMLIKLDPKNLILFSEGVTFCRLPFNINEIDLERLALKPAPNDLSDFFKAEFTLPDQSHQFANWWGILQLWEVQKAVENITGKKEIELIIPEFDTAFKKTKNYDGLIALYLKQKQKGNIENQLNSLVNKRTERTGNTIRHKGDNFNVIDTLKEEINDLNNKLQELNHKQSLTGTGWFERLILKIKLLPPSIKFSADEKIEILKRLQASEEQLKQQQEYLEIEEFIKTGKRRIYERRRYLVRKLNKLIKNAEENQHFITGSFSLSEARNNLKTKNPAIIFVDDQAEEGWSTIFQRIIYGGTSEKFITIIPAKKESIEEIANRIINQVKRNSASLLILDLRLRGEKGPQPNPAKLSGFRVLQILKERKIGCPVLITTASNKVWSYKQMIAQGATAYWIKEGLEDNYQTENTVENYLRFVDLIHAFCCNPEIRFLYKDFYSYLMSIKNSQYIFWWESEFWKDKKLLYPKTKPIDKNEVIVCLDRAFELFEDYLKLKIQEESETLLASNFASLIIIQCARVLEIIHRVDRENDETHLRKKMKDQLDKTKFNRFKRLLNIRNSSVHSMETSFHTIEIFIELLFEYLNNESIWHEFKKFEIALEAAKHGKILRKRNNLETH